MPGHGGEQIAVVKSLSGYLVIQQLSGAASTGKLSGTTNYDCYCGKLKSTPTGLDCVIFSQMILHTTVHGPPGTIYSTVNSSLNLTVRTCIMNN